MNKKIKILIFVLTVILSVGAFKIVERKVMMHCKHSRFETSFKRFHNLGTDNDCGTFFEHRHRHDFFHDQNNCVQENDTTVTKK